MKLDTRFIAASVATMAALSAASAQQPTLPPFQPLTVIFSTTQATGSPTWDRVLRAVAQGLRDRVENSPVLRFASLDKATGRGASWDSSGVVVRFYGAGGDVGMAPTMEWFIGGPLKCRVPRPKYHGSVPMTPPNGGPGDAAPVVAALITTLESIAKESDRCQT
jgi:hypothetical protein